MTTVLQMVNRVRRQLDSGHRNEYNRLDAAINSSTQSVVLEFTPNANVEVGDPAGYEKAFSDFASQGYTLVIGHGFQFGEPATATADRTDGPPNAIAADGRGRVNRARGRRRDRPRGLGPRMPSGSVVRAGARDCSHCGC